MTIKNTSARDAFNKTSPVEGLASHVNATKNVLKCSYDFAVNGGAEGTIQLWDDEGNRAVLPVGAIVTNTVADVITSFTDAGATATFIVQCNSQDLTDSHTVDELAAGLVNGTQTGVFASWDKITATAPVVAVIANEALTAGKANIFIEYFVSE